MGSFATVTPANMELTPCIVKHGGVDMGGTHGNVKIGATFKKAEIKADQFGETVLDYRVSGHEFKIETVIAETKNKDRWKTVFPNARRIVAGNGAVYFVSAIGDSDLTHALPLTLHPMSIDAANLDFDHTFFLAVAESASEVTFGPTEQQGLKIVWRILPDTSVVPARFWFHGNPANGAVPASAGTPSGAGNTGNGTMTLVTVVNAATKTETITALCVGVDGSGNKTFYVSGSISGALGVLTVATLGSEAFTSAVINFTITDGATPFVKGDAFAVATVGANWA
jgi:hypothetical protein